MLEKENLKLVKTIDTKLQTMRFYEDENKKLVFTLDTFAQFKEGEDEEIYHYNLVDNTIEEYKILIEHQPTRFLILGGGDGLAARNIYRKLGVEYNITLVDIDKELVEYFQRFTEFNKGSIERCNKYYMDAIEWVKIDGNKYDIIILDFPDATSKELEKLYVKEFYIDVCKLLAEGGHISIQVNYDMKEKISTIIKEILKNSQIMEYTMPWMGTGAIIVGHNAKSNL